MTKPRAWRGCLNQMLIPYLLRGCTSGCSSALVESPLPLARGWGEGAGGGRRPGTASPPTGTQCWLGARVPRTPPRAPGRERYVGGKNRNGGQSWADGRRWRNGGAC